MAEIQDRHRKAALAKIPGPDHLTCDCFDCHHANLRRDGYAQALADVEDANGYDLTACRAAYALVCEAVTPGVGPGGAEAVAMSVQLLRRRAERAEAERDRLAFQRDVLWALLDDIDTASDRYKSDLDGFSRFVDEVQQKRHELVRGDEIECSLRERLGDERPYFLGRALLTEAPATVETEDGG